MRALGVEITGMLRFAQTIRVDFRELPDGLIAIVGDNGEGKTTLLETSGPAPWERAFVSRKKRPHDYAHGPHSYYGNWFELGGRVYRTGVQVDGIARKSNGLVQEVLPDGRRVPLTDGVGVAEYDAWIAEHLPDPRLLYAGPFAAQTKRGAFADLDLPGRKALFASMVPELEEWQEMSLLAKASAAHVAQGRATLQARRDLLTRDVAAIDAAALDARAAALARDLLAQVARRDGLAAILADLVDRQAAARAAAQARDAALARVREAEAALLALQREQAALAQEGARRVDEALQRDLDAARVAADTQRLDTRKRIDSNRGVQTDAVAIRASAARLREAEGALVGLRAEDVAARTAVQDAATALDRAQQDLRGLDDRAAQLVAEQTVVAAFDTREVAERALDALRAQEAVAAAVVGDARRQHDATIAERSALVPLAAELAHAERAAAQIETLPFGEQCVASGCAFVQQAVTSRAALPDLRAAVAALPGLDARMAIEARVLSEAQVALQAAERARYSCQLPLLVTTRARDAAVQAVETLTTSLARRPEVEAAAGTARLASREAGDRLADVLTAIREMERVATEARPLAQRLGPLENADARIAELEQRLVAIDADLARQEADAHTRADEARARHASRLTEIAAERPVLEAEVQSARTEADQHTLGAADLATVDAALIDHQQWRESCLVQIATVEQQVVGIDQQRAEAARRREALDQVEARLHTLDTEWLEWLALEEALGRDGLQTLEIANIGPAISGHGNDLIRVGRGGRLSMELVTQVATANGKGIKEVFDLRVWDAERPGGARDISDLSPGEQVWVDAAFRFALVIFNNRRAATPFLTCWLDETTSALSAERAERYIPMLRRFRELAGFAQVFFVSHAPGAAAQADAQLHCHDGGVDRLLPPYPEMHVLAQEAA